MTNSTFESALCANLTARTSIKVIDSFSGKYFTLPECFWTLTSTLTQLTEISLQSVIISGSQSQPDPLQRFSTILTSITLDHVRLLNLNSPSSEYLYTPNWNAFFSARPLLTQFSVSQANMQGPLPPTLPTLCNRFNVTHNALTGTVPSGIMSNAVASLYDDLEIDLSYNRLEGTLPSTLLSPVPRNLVRSFGVHLQANQLHGPIPSDFLSPLDNNTFSYVTLDLSSNRFSGSVPSDFLRYNLTGYYDLDVSFARNQLTGSLNSGFFSNVGATLRSVQFDWSSNLLEGTIPDDLFMPLMSNLTTFDSFGFRAANNRLTGSVPNFWPAVELNPSLYSVVFGFSGNSLNGTLPSSLGPPVRSGSFTNLRTVAWDLSSNQLSGSISNQLLGAYGTQLSFIYIRLQKNELEGPLPYNFTFGGPSTSAVVLSLASNRLSGTLPENLLSTFGTGILDLSLDLSANTFTGAVPDGFLHPFTVAANEPRALDLNLSSCGLSGPFPKFLRGRVFMSNIYLDNNRFTGEFPSSDLFVYTPALGPRLLVSASNNAITGTLALPSMSTPYPVTVNLARNDLDAFTVDGSASYVVAVDVSENLRMTGSIPQAWLGSSSKIISFSAGRTSLSGSFPSVSVITAIPLRTLNLTQTPNIDYCSGSRSAMWLTPNLTRCDLSGTDAATLCPSKYPSVCTSGRVDEPTSNEPSSVPSPSAGAALVAPLVVTLLTLASFFVAL